MSAESQVRDAQDAAASMGGTHMDGGSEKVNHGPEPPKFMGWDSGKGED